MQYPQYLFCLLQHQLSYFPRPYTSYWIGRDKLHPNTLLLCAKENSLKIEIISVSTSNLRQSNRVSHKMECYSTISPSLENKPSTQTESTVSLLVHFSCFPTGSYLLPNLVKIPLYFLYSFIPLPYITLISLCFGSTCTPLTLLQLRFLL